MGDESINLASVQDKRRIKGFPGVSSSRRRGSMRVFETEKFFPFFSTTTACDFDRFSLSFQLFLDPRLREDDNLTVLSAFFWSYYP